MTLEPIQVSRWRGSLGRPVCLFVRAGIGLTFVLAAMSPMPQVRVEKHHRSHTVNQLECHSEYRQDKIPELASLRQCKSCGRRRDKSAFASKGRGRQSALSKTATIEDDGLLLAADDDP